MGADCNGDGNRTLRGLVMWTFKLLVPAVVAAAFTLAGAAYLKAGATEVNVARVQARTGAQYDEILRRLKSIDGRLEKMEQATVRGKP